MTEDEIVEWHHQLNAHEFEYAPGVGDGQGIWHTAVHGVTKSWTCLSDWTELNWYQGKLYQTGKYDIYKCIFSYIQMDITI